VISLKSIVTRKLLNYFFINPEESLYINEITGKLGLDKRNLVKKLKELEREGILRSQKRGNLKLYAANVQYPLYNEYKKIVSKTVGFQARLKELVAAIDGIKSVYIYGSYAADNLNVHSDIDVLIIGSHDVIAAQRALSKLQREIDRQINVVNMDETEFRKRKKNRDPFISGIFSGKNIKII